MTRRRTLLGLLAAAALLCLLLWLWRSTADDYEERFARIQLDMNEETVCAVMDGPPRSHSDPVYTSHSSHLAKMALWDTPAGLLSTSDTASVWLSHDSAVVVRFGSDGKVVKKQFYVLGRPGVFEWLEDRLTGSIHYTMSSTLEAQENK